MATNEQKAYKLIAEAEKKRSNSTGFFSTLFGDSAKLEEAVECYQRAAILFNIARNWPQAAVAFHEAGNLHYKMGSRHDAATNYVNASTCYKKCDLSKALDCLHRAIDLYTDMGRFTMAAKYHQTLAELLENETVDYQQAVQHYEQAADYYFSEESTFSGNKCLLKIAHFSAGLEKYDKAIQLYEQVAASSLECSLLKYSAKEYFFRAVLCHLCVDVLNAQHALQRYVDIYPAFKDTREYKLLEIIIEQVEDQDIDGFTETVRDYDAVSRFDQWYTNILLRIKKQLGENPDLR